ncbi:Phosphate starvation-inducible protein PhoH [Commensalibacter communis]|uniref:PhoH family protein n=1 Tax=Commensalibacter communis TaxID=2972786 RepID=UPI0022FF5BAF|nr:PhoH family protein [Commensalibacter communis]CAI3929946.1 Phosphate starvation-inducible protein PhoH [Commensalibacter communis]
MSKQTDNRPLIVSEESLDASTLKTTLQFSDNLVLAHLIGEHDRYLVQIEKELQIKLGCRGNHIVIEGNVQSAELAKAVLSNLYNHIYHQKDINSTVVNTIIRMTQDGLLETNAYAQENPNEQNEAIPSNAPTITTRRGTISARTAGQAEYLKLLLKHEMVFGIGPAGTGKTFLAVAQAVSMLLSGQVDRIILSRPAVEAGERLGFLPGDMKDKIDPYLRPLYDALHAMMPGDQVIKRLTNGEIEVAPLAFMRGRTLEHAYVILDEAQNTTTAQMKMFLTRLGPGSRMVITGDISQIDLPSNIKSGLKDAVETLEGIQGIEIMRFQAQDVVRHPLVGRIVKAYDKRDAQHRPDTHKT